MEGKKSVNHLCKLSIKAKGIITFQAYGSRAFNFKLKFYFIVNYKENASGDQRLKITATCK